MRVGKQSVVNKMSFGSEPYLINIGNESFISSSVKFVNNDSWKWIFRELTGLGHIKKYGTIDIVNRVFISKDRILLPNSKISGDIIVMPNSVVSGNLDESGIYTGVPAKKEMSINEYMIMKKEEYYMIRKIMHKISQINFFILKKKGLKIRTNCRLMTKEIPNNLKMLNIGNHCTITSGVVLDTMNNAYRFLCKIDDSYNQTINIKDNCFIGNNAVIMPGVTINNNTVIAAGTVVFESYPANVVLVGKPAKILCSIDEYIENSKWKSTNILESEDKKKKALINYFYRGE